VPEDWFRKRAEEIEWTTALQSADLDLSTEENEMSIKSELKLIERLAMQSRYAEAIRRLDEIEKASPHEARIWDTRAYVNSRMGAKDEAIANWTKAISICDKEPLYFYMRGIELFSLGRFRDAIGDFTKVIELCDYYASDYYRSEAHFFRADAHLRLGEFEEAKSDCARVPDAMRTWTDRLRTKAEILAQCNA
jgi:tetratricopeptide (TPR) repeat protein